MTRSTTLHCSLSAALLLAALASGGCGKPQTALVSGKVTFDGTPLANGTISFVPAGGATATAGVPIKDGQYTAEMPPGKKSVQISAMKSIGKRQVYQGDPNSPVVDNVQEMIPAQYNAATTLSIDAPAGRSEHHFALKSKP
jgi:type 1 fimbria pilin